MKKRTEDDNWKGAWIADCSTPRVNEREGDILLCIKYVKNVFTILITAVEHLPTRIFNLIQTSKSRFEMLPWIA